MADEAKLALLENQLFSKAVECQEESTMVGDKTDRVSVGLRNYYLGKAEAYGAVYSLVRALFIKENHV